MKPFGVQAKNFRHHLGAISIVNSDSLGMGRMGETVRRTFQLAGHPALRSADSNDNDTVLQFLAKITVDPAIAHGIATDVGNLLPGRLTDIVLWKPDVPAGVRCHEPHQGGYGAQRGRALRRGPDRRLAGAGQRPGRHPGPSTTCQSVSPPSSVRHHPLASVANRCSAGPT